MQKGLQDYFRKKKKSTKQNQKPHMQKTKQNKKKHLLKTWYFITGDLSYLH